MRTAVLKGPPVFAVTERDVSRTDRHNTFFSGNDNPGLTLLHDVLMTYCMFNFDLGTYSRHTSLFMPGGVEPLVELVWSVQVTSRG